VPEDLKYLRDSIQNHLNMYVEMYASFVKLHVHNLYTATVGMLFTISHTSGIFKLQWFKCSWPHLGISFSLQESY